MSSKTKLIFLLLVILIILAGFLVLWRFKGKPIIQPAVINEPEIMEETMERQAAEENSVAAPEKIILNKEGELEIQLLQQASDFAERFGSYSAAGNLQNIEELKPFMTESMRKRADEYAVELREEMSEDFGVTAKVISRSTIEFNPERKITILLSAQRQESASGKENVNYKEMDVEMVKENGEWKVNKAEWRK